MKNILLLAIALIFLSSCSKSGDFELNFKATFKDEPLIFFEAVSLGDIDVKFEKLTFFLTDIELENEDGEIVKLSDAEFYEFEPYDLETANNGVSKIFNDISADTYNKLSFTIGVAVDLNAMSPSDFNIDHPLARNDHYWEAWASYIFSKTEGSADVGNNGVFDLKFFYHTGSDPLARRFEINEQIVIDSEENTTLELFIDYNEMMKQANGSYFNIVDFPINHRPDDLDVLTEYVDNYVNAIKLKF